LAPAAEQFRKPRRHVAPLLHFLPERASRRPRPPADRFDRIARYYTGDRYSDRERESVSAWIEVESWYGWHGGGFWTGKR